MGIRRRSTVHDLTTLRLHPDGSRVQPDTSGERKTRHSRGSIRGSRLARNIGHDVHGNRIALDAGGSSVIKQRKGVASRNFGESEEVSERAESVRNEAHQEVDTIAGSKERFQPKRRTPSPSQVGGVDGESDGAETVKGQRAKKRRRFYEDFSFLSGLPSNRTGFVVSEPASIPDAVSPSQHVIRSRAALSQPTLPVPSSDLLKFIHHFASGYYATCGCLYNAPKIAREERKLRKVAKLREAVAGKAAQGVSDEDTAGPGTSDDIGNSSDSNKKDDGNKAGQNGTEQTATGQRRRRKKIPKGMPRRDMYKSFDGSALIAIGMLLQEYAAELLGADAPGDWLRQVEASQEVEANEPRGKRSRKKMEHEGNLGEIVQVEERNVLRSAEGFQDSVDLDDGDNATSDGSSSDSMQ